MNKETLKDFFKIKTIMKTEKPRLLFMLFGLGEYQGKALGSIFGCIFDGTGRCLLCLPEECEDDKNVVFKLVDYPAEER